MSRCETVFHIKFGFRVHFTLKARPSRSIVYLCAEEIKTIKSHRNVRWETKKELYKQILQPQQPAPRESSQHHKLESFLIEMVYFS